MPIKSLFSFKSQSITSAAFLIGAFALLSRLIGLVRARIFAYKFGAGIELDMYYAAFRLPDLIFNIIVMGAISSAFIPVFTHYRLNSSKHAKDHWYLANNVLHTLSLAILIIACGLMITAPYFIPLIAPGFTSAQKTITVTLTRIMLIQPIILAISGVVSGVLQSYKNFFAYALAPSMYNMGIIIGALFFVPLLGVYGLAWGVVLGALLHLCIQLPTLLGMEYKYKFIFDLKEKGLKEVMRLALPRSFGLATVQINIIVITAIASTIAVGSISVFNYANDIQYVPLGIVGIAFATAAFPSLSESFSKKDRKSFQKHLQKSIRESLFLVVPVAVLFFVLRIPIIKVILRTGVFTPEDAQLTASCLGLFCLGIPFQSMVPLFSRSFYALHNTLKPVLINTVGVVANIAFSIGFVNIAKQNPAFFAPIYNFFGLKLISGKAIILLPLAYSIAGIINAILLFLFLKQKLANLKTRQILTSLFKVILSSLVLFVSSWYILHLLNPGFGGPENLIKGGIAGACGIAFYGLTSWFLNGKELKSALETIFRKTEN